MTDATWNAVPGSGDFNTDSNWSANARPDGSAIFGASTTVALSISAATFVGGFIFNVGAPSYTITVLNTQFLVFDGAGIVNGASLTLVNDDTFVFGDSDGIFFTNSSSAGAASITNNGFLGFFVSSSAGSAQITNADLIQFQNNSTAGNAVITTHSNASVEFFQRSTGGGARFITDINGITDFSQSKGTLGDHKVSAGSIEGDGNYVLGINSLAVGGNNLSTEVSGVISGARGAVIKVGTGKLTLSGVNIYKGATTVNAGSLKIDGSITSTVLVNAGATLQGDGTTGALTVANIGTVAPGGSAGILHVGATNLAVGAIFSAEIGGVNAGVGGYDQLSVVGGVKIGGAVLSLSLIGGFDPVAGTQFVVLNNDGVETALGKFDVPDIFWIAAGNRVFGINYHGGDGNDVAITAEGAMIVGTNGDDIIDVTHTAFGQPTDRDDIIVADGGNDQLNGGGGSDMLHGGSGDDTLDGGDGTSDVASYREDPGVTVDLTITSGQDTGGAGTDILLNIENLIGSLTGDDHLTGNLGSNVFYGLGGNDTLDGAAGDDLLIGGLGKDTLTGGVNFDVFIFDAAVESAKGSNRDVITDFHRSEGDKIGLSDIDANIKTSLVDNHFKFIGAHKFDHNAGELHYVKKAGFVIVEGDINGNGKADFQIEVHGVTKLVAGDFFL